MAVGPDPTLVEEVHTGGLTLFSSPAVQRKNSRATRQETAWHRCTGPARATLAGPLGTSTHRGRSTTGVRISERLRS